MKRYIAYVAFGTLLAFVVLGILLYRLETELYDTEISKIEQYGHTMQAKIEDFKDNKDTFITMITQDKRLREVLQETKSDALKQSEMFFYNLVEGDRHIMQLRLINKLGMEKIRVDRVSAEEQASIIPDAQLQNKSSRYYVQEFLKLPKGVISYSELDLNVEHHKVEIPFVPTVRIGMPIYIGKDVAGIVVINYRMDDWLRELATIPLENFYLIDSEGYFIIHPKDEYQWSRYIKKPLQKEEYFKGYKFHSTYNKNLTVNKNLFIKSIHLFKNQKMLAIYEPKVPLNQYLFLKFFEISLYLLCAVFFILVPTTLLIRAFIIKLTEEKEYNLTIINNTFDAMFVINKLGIIQQVNLAAQTLFKYQESELVGKNINMLIPEPHHSLHNGYLRDYKDDGKSIVLGYDRELFAIDKFEDKIIISLSVTKIVQNNEIYFIGSIRDLSELKKAQDQQREQEMYLLQQSKLAALGEMLTAIAHQWRQPLNAIGLITQDLLSANKYNELNDDYLEKSSTSIMEQLKLLSDTIDEFRNFFSNNNEAQYFNVRESIEQIRTFYWAQFKSSAVHLCVTCKNAKGIQLFCSKENEENKKLFDIYSLPSELKQVLLNLIANAKDAIEGLDDADEYQRTITIELIAKEEQIEIEIFDNAGGIDETIIERIFEPYYTTKEMGTGLGLFIVKTLIDKHLHGNIICKNCDNHYNEVSYKGTRFSISLPKQFS